MTGVYAIDQLMQQTRELAAEYYRTTQQTLPVSQEIAKYDACQLLDLTALDDAAEGVDAVDVAGRRYQIKSRVLFKDDLRGYRLGQINLQAQWDNVVLVLMNQEYCASEIYRADREVITQTLTENENSKRQQRGIMSVSKFKAIAECIWHSQAAS